MKRILSSLLFSTATFGGVVGLVAQNKSELPNSVSDVPAPSTSQVQQQSSSVTDTSNKLSFVNQANAQQTTAVTTLSADQIVEEKTSETVAGVSPVGQSIAQETTVAYEEVQALRTGYSSVVSVEDYQVDVQASSEPVATVDKNESETVSNSIPAVVEQPSLAPQIVAVNSSATTDVAPADSHFLAVPALASVVEKKTERINETSGNPSSEETSKSLETVAIDNPLTKIEDTTKQVEKSLENVVSPSAVFAEEKSAAIDEEAIEKDEPQEVSPFAAITEKIVDKVAETLTVSSVEVPAVTPAPTPAPVLGEFDYAPTPEVTYEDNTYPVGQCTWGAKALAPWVGNYWGNAADWIASAQAAGFRVGTTPEVGAVAVWPYDGGGYGHLGLVTAVASETRIQVSEANYSGNQTIANYRGWFNPTASIWGGGTVYYIYPNS